MRQEFRCLGFGRQVSGRLGLLRILKATGHPDNLKVSVRIRSAWNLAALGQGGIVFWSIL